jgi:hypothetical protein
VKGALQNAPFLPEGVPSRSPPAKRYEMKKQINLEIVYEGDQCPASYYMAQAVLEVLDLYGDRIAFTKLEYKKNKEHSKRFQELSIDLHGEEAFRKRMQLAPIPSIFIDGQLVFDAIPVRDELISRIDSFLSER